MYPSKLLSGKRAAWITWGSGVREPGGGVAVITGQWWGGGGQADLGYHLLGVSHLSKEPGSRVLVLGRQRGGDAAGGRTTGAPRSY